jgi:hypothetical protein
MDVLKEKTITDIHDAMNGSWVLCTRDLHKLVRDLRSYKLPKRSRKFDDKSECLKFMKRVAVVFKDFPYKKDGVARVEREVWFEDLHGDKVQEFQYVIVHIHFKEFFDWSLDKLRKQQKAHVVASVNLRHYKTSPSPKHDQTGYYESIFKGKYS